MRYKVAAISGNTNSFGLRSVILVSPECHVWQVLSNALSLPKLGAEFVLNLPSAKFLKAKGMTPDGYTGSCWSGKGWECPEQLPDCPIVVAREVFCKTRA
jgi:hypothetical protein